MELIYIYIEKYRTFENQKMQFSDKFFIDYDEKLKKLSIEKNKNYIDLYPDNIVNINGVLGRNGTGKTSLLSLIGEKIETRHSTHEIFADEYKNPHKKRSIFSPAGSKGVEDIRYSSSYFLVYCTEIDGKTTFVFETNTPQKYISIFENSDEWIKDRPEYGPIINYYIGKGWFAAAFKRENKKNILLDDIQHNPLDNKIKNKVTILFFGKTPYRNKMDVVLKNEEESIIAIKRKSIPMKGILYENQFRFLVKQMNLSSSPQKMYRDEKYEVSIEFADYIPKLFYEKFGPEIDSDKIIEDYRNFEIDQFSDWEKIILAFLNQYTMFLVKMHENINGVSKAKIIATDLCEISMKNTPTTYMEIKEVYYEKIGYILRLIDNEFITLAEVQKCEGALEQFLRNASKWGFNYKYEKSNNLIVEIFKDSNIDVAKGFFESFVDEDMRKNLEREDSVLGGFLEINLLRLSDGEQENLSFFASIDEQIALNSNSNQFIMLFDEIERSMHPELCRSLISELIDIFKQYHDKEFQIIIASHSPFIASDLLKENIICLSREKNGSKAELILEQTFAQNIHTILKSHFFLDSFLGEYAIRSINLLLECLKLENNKKIIKQINDFLGCSNSKRIVTLNEAKQFIQFVIQSIGEPLISRELEQRFAEKDWWQLEGEIEYYKQKVAELEERIND